MILKILLSILLYFESSISLYSISSDSIVEFLGIFLVAKGNSIYLIILAWMSKNFKFLLFALNTICRFTIPSKLLLLLTIVAETPDWLYLICSISFNISISTFWLIFSFRYDTTAFRIVFSENVDWAISWKLLKIKINNILIYNFILSLQINRCT